jgi:hypothetical protein
MYNYSPSKLYRGEKTRTSSSVPVHIGSLDNLPAVPDRHSSASLFDSVNDDPGSHQVFNLYDRIDNLSLNFDKECDESAGSGSHQATGAAATRGDGGGGPQGRDEFQTQMEQIEQTMKSMALPRFKLPDRPLKLAENR